MFCLLLFIIIAVTIFINTDYGKNIVRKKVQAYLQGKIKTKFTIGSIDYSFPKSIALENVYLEDLKMDTLFYGERLAVNLDMIKLIWGNISVSRIDLKNIKGNIYRNENDSIFNFQFLIDAFASKKAKAKKDTTTTNIIIKELLLNNFSFRFTDKYEGKNIITTISKLDVTIDKFQPDKLLFAIDKFKSNGLNFSMENYSTIHNSIQKANLPEQGNSTAKAIHITANSFNLSNGSLQLHNNKTIARVEGFDASHIDARNININAKDIFYTEDSTAANLKQLAFAEHSGLVLDTTKATIIYTKKQISAKGLYIKTPQSLIQNEVQLTYDDLSKLMANPKKTKISANLKNTTIAINDIYIWVPSLKKQLPVAKFKDNLIKLNTEINGDLERLNISMLQVQGLSGSSVNAKAILNNITDSAKLGYDVAVYNARLFKSDLEKFIRNKNTGELPPEINFTTHIKGNKQNTVANINIAGNGIKFIGKADVNNIDNPSKLKYNIAIANSSVAKKLLTKFIPPDAIPPDIKLPDLILLNGSVKGDANNVEPMLVLNGSYGQLTVKGYVHNFKNKDAANYNLTFSTTDFALGKLLSQDSVLGNITLSGTAKGRGFDYKKMKSDFTVNVQKAFIKNYNYTNANVNAKLLSGSLMTKGDINDANLQMHYQATANISGQYPSGIDALIIMDTLQLMPLHFYNDTLNTSFRMAVKARDCSPKNLNLDVLIDSSCITKNKKNYYLDTIEIRALKDNGKNNLTLKSPLADVFAEGDFDYDEIGPSVLQYIDKYYNVTGTPNRNLRPQKLVLNGIIKKHPLISDAQPGLTYEEIKFDGKYNSPGGDSTLNFHTYIPTLTYQDKILDSGKINIHSYNNKINYSVGFNKLRLEKNTFYVTTVSGDVANDSLRMNAVTKDNKNKDRFGIAAALTAKEKNYTVYLRNDLLVNYKKWNVSPANKISYSPHGILVKDFYIQSDRTKIAANSKEEIPNSPIDIEINNFDIKDIASITNTDTLMASGMVNAKINVSNFNKKLPAFVGNISIDSFFFKQQPVGNVKINATNQTENTVDATIDISGYGNAVNIKGTYYLASEEKQFDAELNLQHLRAPTVQAFAAGTISNSRGDINGKLQLTGNFKEPKWNGYINLDTTKFTVSTTGVSYLLDKQKISLAYPVISFEKFTIKDTANNSLTINGSITAHSISAYDLGLTIHSNNLILVNTPKKIGSTVYGFAAADIDVNVNGSNTNPDIEGNITLNNKTDVAILLPEQNINKDAAAGVVRFIDRDSFQFPEKNLFTPAIENNKGGVQFINYNLNISVNKNAALTIVIDPSSGDELKVRGDAELNAGVDPGGHIVVAGNYALSSGYYNMSYQFLKKKFNLLEGSTISFSGSPMDAQVDIVAEYIANAAPADLLQNEIGQFDSKMANTFNQKIPFRVLLYLKGDLKKPAISFDIQLPDESANLRITNEMRTTIENKLTQVRADATLTNKEIFSLLLLGRFVGEQSTDFFKGNGSGSGADNLARESVTKFLSAALNEIASDIVKGIDVDLNLNSYQDFSTGDAQQRTDLNVAISKSFLDDRLTITAGKNFGVEGQDPGSKTVQQNNNSFPDITLNYKLSKDGKYALRAYRKDQFEVTVDGYVVETGVAFIVTFNYEKFKDLFRKNKKEKVNKSTKGND